MNQTKPRLVKAVKHVVLSIVSLIAIFPVFWILLSSLKTRVQVFSFPPVFLFTPNLTNYNKILFESEIPRHLLNSAIITTCSVLLALLLGMPAAYAFARHKFRHKESMYFLLFTIRMGPAIGFIIPFYLICREAGLLDTHIALILIYQTFDLPITIWLMRGFIEEVPREIDEAALIDGCSPLESLLKVVIPAIKPGLAATAILCALFSWNEFFMAAILTRNVARTVTVDMPIYIGLTRIRWEEMTAAASVALAPTLAFALIVRKYIIRGLTLGAIKG